MEFGVALEWYYADKERFGKISFLSLNLLWIIRVATIFPEALES